MASISRRSALRTLSAFAGLHAAGADLLADPAPTPLEKAFDELVAREGFTSDGPGLAVMSRQSGGPRHGQVFVRGVGLARLKDRTPVTPDTMFELASVSKIMTATAVLQLHDQKKLAVTDDIRKHIPELPEYSRAQPIRIRDLLQHTSGLASYFDFQDVPAKNQEYWVNDDYIGEFARQKIPQSFPTGARYEYNNSNYLVLAVLIARVSGKSYGGFLRESIFGPAGMKTAFVSEGPGSIPKVAGREDAIGYVEADGGWREEWSVPPHRQEKLLTCGDGSIWCSARDMAAWDAFVHGGQMLKPATVKLALTPSKTRDGKTNGTGLGWALYYEGAKPAGYWHNGGWGGFGTYYYHDIASGRSIAMLGNGRPLDMDKFWYALTTLLDQSSALDRGGE